MAVVMQLKQPKASYVRVEKYSNSHTHVSFSMVFDSNNQI